MPFFPDGVRSVYGVRPTLLQAVVNRLPSNVKQAMYAAGSKGLIKRGTWNGCAFNVAGLEVGDPHVSTYESAARAFNCDPMLVMDFISVWDTCTGSDEHCTKLLMEAIEKSGITAEPGERKKIVRGYAYKSADTQFKEELEKIDCIADIPGITQGMADSVQVLVNA